LVLVEGLYLCNTAAIGGADSPQGPASNLAIEARAGAGEAAPPAAAAGAGRGDAATPVLAAEQAASWSRVRSLLDFVIYLDVPMAVCRARVVARKVATGVPPGEAAAYYARVDLPIYQRLGGVDRLTPGRAASTLPCCDPASGGETAASFPAGCSGPDLVLQYQVTPASGLERMPSAAAAIGEGGAHDCEPTASLSVAAATLNGGPWCLLSEPARAAVAPAGVVGPAEHASSTSQLVVVLGLNPCVQKTLVFGKPPLAGMGASASGAQPACPAWVRGEVNRATTSATSVGGKGQHTCIAIARAAAHATAAAAPGGSGTAANDERAASPSTDRDTRDGCLPAGPAVHLFQFLAGERGSDVARMLRTSLQSLQERTGAHQGTLGGHGGDMPEGVELHSFWSTPPADGSTCTRTCITLVDAAAGDSTELIEPSPPVPAALVDQLLAGVQRSLRSAADAGRSACLAIMGTAPPGAAEAYAQLLACLTSSGSAGAASACVPLPRPLPFVLLDLSARVGPLLASGAVSLLKVNAAELRVLAAELPSSASHPRAARGLPVESEGRSKADDVAADAMQLLLEHCRPAPAAASEARLPSGLRMIAVTDGPHAAHLFQVAAPGSLGPSSDSPMLSHAAGTPGLEATLAVSHWSYSLPAQLPLPVLNPIGAGDTVAGNFLFHHCCAGQPAWFAYGRALAAGSASCMTLTGALWDAGVAAEIQSGIRVRHQTLLWEMHRG